jgi:amino acid transporter
VALKNKDLGLLELVAIALGGMIGGGIFSVLILEFASLTFIIVSLLMALANLKLRKQTGANPWLASTAVIALATGGVLILAWQLRTEPAHLAFTIAVGLIVIVSSNRYARMRGPSRRDT